LSSESRPASSCSSPSRLSSKKVPRSSFWMSLKLLVMLRSIKHLADGGQQLRRIEGFDEPAGGPRGLGGLLFLRIHLRRENQDRSCAVGRQLTQLADEREPVHARHVEVADHQVKGRGLGNAERARAAIGLGNAVTSRL